MVKAVNCVKMYVVGQGSKEEGQMPSRARRRRYVAKGCLLRRRFRYCKDPLVHTEKDSRMRIHMSRKT